jgi:hypothetical protein
LITPEDEENLTTGGNCSIFDILHEMKKAFRNQPKFLEKVSLSMKPDLFQSGEMAKEYALEYSILKVTQKIARHGRDIKSIFASWDTNNDKFCKFLFLT